MLVQPGRPDNPRLTGGLANGRRVDVERLPLPTVTATPGSIGGIAQHWLEDDGRPVPARNGSKPPYRVPPLAELLSTPRNGLVAADLFAGCGGTALGLAWAGYDVRYACEIARVPAASYAANLGHAPDRRDVREVTADDVLGACGVGRGELDLLAGSPPCTSFSMAGKRDSGWGVTRHHAGTDQRVDDLFFEFGRLLEGLMPRAFLAENVTGLVRGRAKGYFRMIVAKLAATGYRVETAVLDASWLGVPQARQRVYIYGVREDLDRAPAWPAPLPYRYSVRDALPDLRLGTDEEFAEADISRFAIGREWDGLRPGGKSDKYFSLMRADPERPLPTVTAAAIGDAGSPVGAAAVTHPTERRKFTIPELRRLCGFPDDYELRGSWGQQWQMMGNCVVPPMARAVGGAAAGVLAR